MSSSNASVAHCREDLGGQSKVIDIAWEILDIEYADRKKRMDLFLAEINNYGVVRSDPKSLARYVTSIYVYLSDMEDNGCPVEEASEAPFFIFQGFCPTWIRGTIQSSAERCNVKRKKKTSPI